MAQIISALLTDQRKVYIQGIEVCLKPLKKGTFKQREQEAEKRAKEIMQVINS